MFTDNDNYTTNRMNYDEDYAPHDADLRHQSFKQAQAHLVGQSGYDDDLDTFVVNQEQLDKNLTMYDAGMMGIDSYIEPQGLNFNPLEQ